MMIKNISSVAVDDKMPFKKSDNLV